MSSNRESVDRPDFGHISRRGMLKASAALAAGPMT